MRFAFLIRCSAWCAALVMVAAGASAQLADGGASSVSVGRLVVPGGRSAVALGMQFTNLRPGRTGAEYGFYTIPEALADGLLVLAPRISAVNTTATGGVLIMAKIGGNVTVGVPQGSGSGMGVLGVHLGIGVFAPVSPAWAIRIEAEPLLALGAPTFPTALLLTFGISSLPQRGRGP